MCKTSVYTIVNGNMQQRLALNRNTKKIIFLYFVLLLAETKQLFIPIQL